MNVTTSGTAAGMPGLPEVWQWQEQLVGFGTRYTGSSGHAAYVDWLAGQLSAVPGFQMRTDRLTFSRWLAREFALTVSVPASAGRSGPVPVTYYYPYSGQTPPGGVTGRLVDLGFYPAASGFTEAFWAPTRGGIALVRAAPPVFPLDLAQTPTGGYVPGQISALAAIEYAAYAAALTNPAWQGIFEPVPLLDAKNAGVRGVVVAWTGLPDGEVVNLYNPFTTSYPAASGRPAPAIPAAPPSGSATRPAPSWPDWPRAAGRAPRSCSPRTSPRARRPRRSGAGWKARGTPASTSSSTPTPTGRTRSRRTAGSGSSHWPGTWRPCPRGTATCISRWSRGISSCRNSAAPS